MNDNFRYWDDDMIVGSVHLWETFELFYVLKQMNYDGWYSLDIFPYREHSDAAIRQSLEMVKKLCHAAQNADDEQICQLQKNNDAAGMMRYLRQTLLA